MCRNLCFFVLFLHLSDPRINLIYILTLFSVMLCYNHRTLFGILYILEVNTLWQTKLKGKVYWDFFERFILDFVFNFFIQSFYFLCVAPVTPNETQRQSVHTKRVIKMTSSRIHTIGLFIQLCIRKSCNQIKYSHYSPHHFIGGFPLFIFNSDFDHYRLPGNSMSKFRTHQRALA